MKGGKSLHGCEYSAEGSVAVQRDIVFGTMTYRRYGICMVACRRKA
jgi:hypothetical protein